MGGHDKFIVHSGESSREVGGFFLSSKQQLQHNKGAEETTDSGKFTYPLSPFRGSDTSTSLFCLLGQEEVLMRS